MEYAHATISIGITGDINKDYSIDEVIEIQSGICNKLSEAMRLLTDLIGAYAELNEEE